MLQREYTYKRKTITVTLNAQPVRRFRWKFETSNGLTGNGITDRGLEAAFEAGRVAAEEVIDT